MLLAENVSATDDYTMDIVLKRPIQSRVVRVERQAGILLLDGALRWTGHLIIICLKDMLKPIHCEQGDSR